MLRPFDSIIDVPEYCIARRGLSSGGHSADPLAGDDGWGCGAFVLCNGFNFQKSPQFSCSAVIASAAKQSRAPNVIASAAKQSILSLRGEMDCFAEPVIGRAFARPVGSQ
jgi:hypothetical protein